MPRTAHDKLWVVAVAIRPHITPIIKEKGQLDDEDIVKLAAKHSPHKIRSELSIQMVQEFLCEV